MFGTVTKSLLARSKRKVENMPFLALTCLYVGLTSCHNHDQLPDIQEPSPMQLDLRSVYYYNLKVKSGFLVFFRLREALVAVHSFLYCKNTLSSGLHARMIL
jgi:hypothetical protein